MLADPPPLNPESGAPDGGPRKYPSLRKFCLMQSDIVEPLLLFCTHAIRMRDSRCCSVILRVFRSIVPEFHISNTPPRPQAPPTSSHDGHELQAASTADQYLDTSPVPSESASVIREYVSSHVLRACITSFHEPYFVELQKDLASLIAAIIVYYTPLTG